MSKFRIATKIYIGPKYGTPSSDIYMSGLRWSAVEPGGHPEQHRDQRRGGVRHNIIQYSLQRVNR